MAKKILITGVGGFIGSKVANRFLHEGFDVVGIDDLSSGHLDNVPPSVDFIEADLSNGDIVSRLPSGCSKILHLAGQSSGEISFDDPIADLNKNVASTLNLIRYGIKNKSERIVYASSMSVYGGVPKMPIGEDYPCRPLSCYGVGKLAAEHYLHVYHNLLPSVTLRMFNVYGPGQDLSNLRQGMVSIYLAQALSSGRIEVKGSIERFRDLIFIDDVVEAWFRASTLNAALGKIINIGTGVPTTVGSLLELVCKIVPDSSYFVQGATPGDQSGIYADTTQLKKWLGINEFTTIEVGLKNFSDWAHRQI
jgi:UDP-glucose 4-epimerase